MTLQRAAALLLAVSALFGAGPLHAQEPPAKGPADIINRANEGTSRERMDRAAQQVDEAAGQEEGAGSDADEAVRRAHGGVDQAALRRMMGEGPPVATASASEEVEAGSVRVRVVDEQGEPVEGAPVRLGIMQPGGDRSSLAEPTDADGLAVFDGLATGSGQSYRVSVPHDGAKYGAPPFQLPVAQGYQVEIRRLPVTRDPRVLLQFMGQTILELRDERLSVTQHAQLMNMGDQTFVFPEQGLPVELPAGFTAFQAQEVMSDQRFQATERGFRLHGSIPPGRVQLAWMFDVPVDGSAMELDYPVPFRTYTYRVMTEAVPGLELEVRDMPQVVRRETEAGEVLLTQTRRGPEDPPLERVSIRVAGIPGPGPFRWVAVGGALALAFAGLLLGLRGARPLESDARAREERKRRLVAEAVELERMHARGEVGPRYRERRMDALLDELAVLLKAEDVDAATQSGASKPDKATEPRDARAARGH
ncbi:MAG: carboxypeptidase-like regulatory domain-containing protein [Myxococcota bacterium]